MSAQIAPQSAASTVAPAPDLSAVKARQHIAWSSGDYAIVGTTLQIVGETLCEALDLRAGSTVLDVAAGNGNASLAAARRWCDVTATDYVASLLEGARARAAADKLPLTIREADAEALPFADATFDVVLSTFGVMFAPNQDRCAAEMLRVCRPGGAIGLANWTPEGFIGGLFRTLGRYVPPPAGVKSPALWGTRDRIDALFGAGASSIATEKRHFVFRYRSPAHFVQIFRDYYGPVLKAFAALDERSGAAFEADLLALIGSLNEADDGTMVVPSEYLEVIVRRR
ncbi:MAG TPA: class I SAM-dependent methyltransferase [Burkholderiaceae bacterium]|nr:class I SAM-dependent methyltransferase [Burkholderiaceae bacterium]